MLVHKIDDNGLMLEPYILDSIPILTETQTVTDDDGNSTTITVPVLDENGNTIPDPHYIETPCPNGFYHPKWNGAAWVEGGVKPEPVVTVEMLKAELEATDYKVIKCSECQLSGIESPYDIAALHAERQALRDKINELEKQTKLAQ